MYGADTRPNACTYVCASLNEISIARLLLEHGAAVNGLRTSLYSPLHRAVLGIGNRRNLEMAKLLLDWGADVFAVYDRQRTPLHLACQNVPAAAAADKEVGKSGGSAHAHSAWRCGRGSERRSGAGAVRSNARC